jgi:hypothetical protein
LHTKPQVLALQVADPDPPTGGTGQTRPHIMQLSGSLVRFWQPFVHIVSPAAQLLQSVPAALHADGHAVVVLVHAPAAVHASADVLTPSAHDCAAPHSVPAGLLPLSTQTELPVAHDVMPSLHGLAGVQAAPAVHGTQLPALQTWLVPQPVPFGTAVPLSWQVGVPVVQVSVPLWHGFAAGVQAPPPVHGTQLPLLHTRLVPHAVPFATLPVSAQTGTPVTHEFAPVLHRFVGWQLAPAVHAVQVPLLQTMFVPHDAPLAMFRPVSAQVIDGEHAWVPAWHGLAGVHERPAVHDTQFPELQTRFVPQEVPLATFPDSAQTGAPVLQVVAPVRQGRFATVQLAPTVQAPQVPVALQTRFVPQLVPAGSSAPVSVQTGVPVVQESVPLWHGFVGAQAAPA